MTTVILAGMACIMAVHVLAVICFEIGKRKESARSADILSRLVELNGQHISLTQAAHRVAKESRDLAQESHERTMQRINEVHTTIMTLQPAKS